MRILIIIVKCALIILVGTGHAVYADQPIILSGFQALLFNSKTGLLSADILAKSGSELGNVPIGEFASVSTFIIVKVQIAKHVPVPDNLRVRLIASEVGSIPFAEKPIKSRARVILDQEASLGPVNEEGVTYVGFWLANTGCKTITLKASLVGMVTTQSISNILPFACYE